MAERFSERPRDTGPYRKFPNLVPELAAPFHQAEIRGDNSIYEIEGGFCGAHLALPSRNSYLLFGLLLKVQSFYITPWRKPARCFYHALWPYPNTLMIELRYLFSKALKKCQKSTALPLSSIKVTFILAPLRCHVRCPFLVRVFSFSSSKTQFELVSPQSS
jgi:hypothetical protein